MKQLLLIVALVSACLSGMAQYGTSGSWMSYPVRSLPHRYVPEADRNYNVTLSLSRGIAPYISKDEFRNQVAFNQWEELDDNQQAFCNIFVNAFDFIIESMQPMECKEVIKERDGSMHEHIFFMPKIDYSMVVEWGIKSPVHSEIHSNIVPATGRPPISSFNIDRHFHSPRECHEYIRENKDLFVEKIVAAEIFGLTNAINERMDYEFRYGQSTKTVKIYFYDTKKSAYYDKHREAKQEIRSIIGNMPVEGDLKETIKKLQPWINHYKQLETELNVADKKQLKAKSEILYSLASMYIALEIWDVANDYAQRILTECGDKDGKHLMELIESQQKHLKAHHLASYHF